MKKLAIIVMVLLGCIIHPDIVEAQKVKDAFVLVDVSGSMKYGQINSEAKQIINNMLQGKLTLSEFPGWSRVMTKGLDGNCPLISDKSSLVSAGGKVCIMPFGNMQRVKDYKFVDMTNFDNSFNSSFPNVFRDKWTYITLAKAYTVNVASNNNISGMVYMIVYSDGAEESMDGKVGYSDEFRDVVDYFGTRNDSFCQKKGIIRKSYAGKQFDIEIWTMGPIPTIDLPPPPPGNDIEISNVPEGKSPKAPVEINAREPFQIKWKNATGSTKINVQIKKGSSYSNIPVKDKDNYYTLTKKANSGTITFYELQDYKVIVADENSRDERYIKVKSSGKELVPILIIVILIVGGVLLWKLLYQPKDNTHRGGSGNGNTGGRSSGDDEW